MKPGGDIVSYECITGTQANISIMEMMLKGVSFHGFTIFRVFNNLTLLSSLVQLGMENAERLRPTIADVIELSEAPQALQRLGESSHVGKIVLKI